LVAGMTNHAAYGIYEMKGWYVDHSRSYLKLQYFRNVNAFFPLKILISTDSSVSWT
jgi:hypothetical protein